MELMNPFLMNALAMTAVVSGLLVAAWYVMGLYGFLDRSAEEEELIAEVPDRVTESFAPIPPVMIVFYVFMAIALVTYVAYIWAGGITY